MAIRSQCKTEDSRKRFENESSVPRAAMDHGYLANGTDADLATNPVLIQEPHRAVGIRQVSHEGPEPRAVDCVLENLDTCGLGEVMLKSAIQTLVDPPWVERGERTMAEKSSKCSHKSWLPS